MPIPFDPEAGEAESAPAYFNDKYQATPEQSVRRGKLVLSRAFWKFKRGSIPTARPLSLPPTSPPSRPSLAPLSRQLDESGRVSLDESLCGYLVDFAYLPHRDSPFLVSPSPCRVLVSFSCTQCSPSIPSAAPPFPCTWDHASWTGLCATLDNSRHVSMTGERGSILEKADALRGHDEDEWEVLASLPFVDAQRSPALYRAFFIPGLSERLVKYGSYALLRRKQAANSMEEPEEDWLKLSGYVEGEGYEENETAETATEESRET
ncbi:unnamed protein product [Closterium sp. NIES-64]|nr:unnamed protein product [Closterium sp. NIES-64]